MLLAIDTSTRYAGVALWKDDTPIATLGWYSPHNHTAELLPAIEYVLSKGENGTAGLHGIAVALGPGGFSALRVGISAAKGLALPLAIPIVGVGTLEMEAYPHAGTGLPIRPLLDAGRLEVATAVFQESRARWSRLEDERVATIEEIMESIPRRTLLCGEGVPARAGYLREYLGRRAVIMASHNPASRLWALGVLARVRLERGEADDPADLQPRYLRRPSIGAPRTPQKVKQ